MDILSKEEIGAIFESVETQVDFLKKVGRVVPGIAISRGVATLTGIQAKLQDELDRRAKVEREEAAKSVKPKTEKVD